MGRKQKKAQHPLANDLSTALEVFMLSERALGRSTPPMLTPDLKIESKRSGGCEIKPREYGNGYLTIIEKHFKTATETMRKLNPRAKVSLRIFWTSGGGPVAFRGRAPSTQSRFHAKTFDSPRELEKWKTSMDGRSARGSSRSYNWRCTITRK